MKAALSTFMVVPLISCLAMAGACASRDKSTASSAPPVSTPAPTASPATSTPPAGAAAAPAASDGWITLFDGGDPAKNFRGFKKDSFPTGWTVKDGCLVRTGEGGDLITREQFANFDLTLDWKISKGGNSGVMYHVTEDGSYPWETGPEMQILDDDGHSDGKDRLTSAGANYAMHPAPKGVVKPVGQWNSMRILCVGNHVEYYLNGVQTCSFDVGSEDWKKRMLASKWAKVPTYATKPKGYIALQDHGDEVWFRNIRIKPLP